MCCIPAAEEGYLGVNLMLMPKAGDLLNKAYLPCWENLRDFYISQNYHALHTYLRSLVSQEKKNTSNCK